VITTYLFVGPKTLDHMMKVRFKKVDQNGAALCCERADGSTTWQRPKPTQAAFFALHDLTHCACESELGDLKGFFSLVADGWDIGDCETNSAIGQSLPESALIIEVIVGLLDTERASQILLERTKVKLSGAAY